MANENTIFQTDFLDPRQVEEAIASAAITPGDLVELDASDELLRHNSAGAISQRFFALKNNADAGVVSDDYAADETARYGMALSGDVVFAFLADTIAVVKNVTYLISNGDGSLKAAAAEVGQELVAVALETKTASGKERCLVRVL